ncbi:CAP domain-containing protein, partial [Mycolicibacterium sp.]|uniref:CAP domain-containing protein n=1 Tax=Mycolicibacterium sp. TaxID=2320850 RepID=UPI0028AAF2A6
RLRASGYADASFRVGGENLGWLGGAATPRGMVAAWLASAPHRANMLDPRFRETGVGVVEGTPTGVTGFTFAQEFGARASASTVSSSPGRKGSTNPKKGKKAHGKKSRHKGKHKRSSHSGATRSRGR